MEDAMGRYEFVRCEDRCKMHTIHRWETRGTGQVLICRTCRHPNYIATRQKIAEAATAPRSQEVMLQVGEA